QSGRHLDTQPVKLRGPQSVLLPGREFCLPPVLQSRPQSDPQLGTQSARHPLKPPRKSGSLAAAVQGPAIIYM
ncbi:hypothetical protein JXD38_09745, partial [candidate division WOR-3 bacterium]|nr:hypothetical protein [candidate division WOR-3 bacterium]